MEVEGVEEMEVRISSLRGLRSPSYFIRISHHFISVHIKINYLSSRLIINFI